MKHMKCGVLLMLLFGAGLNAGVAMEMTDVFFIILAGGSGTRLWPLSKMDHPKQLLALGSEATLLDQAINRVLALATKERIWIATTKQHEKSIRTAAEHRVGRVLVEPGARETGPAILYNCFEVAKINPDAIIVFLPADPFIPPRDYQKFADFLEHAIDFSRDHEKITLLGVQPTYPATGYGYIEYDSSNGVLPFPVTRFREKPSESVAQKYLEAGNMLWNISIFAGKVSTFINEFQKEAPQMYEGVKNFMDGKGSFNDVRAESIDYAIMERSSNVHVLPVDFSWCDVGNVEVFLSLKQQYNTLDANFLAVDAHNNLVDVPDKLVALVGVDDLCIVEVGDVLLIVKRDKAEHVRSIVKLLNRGRFKRHL